MNKNEIYEVTIEDISTDGEGIGHIMVNDSRITIFVKDTVVGDRIQARIVKVKKTYVYGRLERLLTPSPYRVEPKCKNARNCGGCTLMQMSYDKQLEYKWNTVRNCLIRIGGLSGVEEKMEPVYGMTEPYYFRNKMQFPVGVDKNGKVTIGFYAGHTHSIIDLNRCEIGHPVNNYILSGLRPWLQQWQDINSKFIYQEETHTGLLRHILIRVGYSTGEVMVCLVVNGTRLPEGSREELIQILEYAVQEYNEELGNPERAVPGGSQESAGRGQAVPDCDQNYVQQRRTWNHHQVCRIASVVLNINRDKTNRILGDTSKTLYGSPYITDYIGDIQFRISAQSFYQVNPVQTKVLYDKAVEYADLTGREVVWDMYCGIGTISLKLAQRAGQVYGVEIVPQAIEDARQNAELNGITNAEFYCGKAEEVVPEFYGKRKSETASGAHPDVVVVDPPRKGCDPELLSTILAMSPERIVYVSCNPSTLARDLKILTEAQYEVQKVSVVDQFGHSTHVETVVLMSRVKD